MKIVEGVDLVSICSYCVFGRVVMTMGIVVGAVSYFIIILSFLPVCAKGRLVLLNTLQLPTKYFLI